MTNTEPTTGKVLLSGKAYDNTKFVALVVLPALAVLYAAVALIWGLPKPTEVVGTITAVDLFLGAILGISTNQYKNSEADKDGVLVVNTSDPNKDTYNFELNTPISELPSKKTITLKVRDDS